MVQHVFTVLRIEAGLTDGLHFREFSLSAMSLFIGLVSLFDAWLVVRYQETILEFEQNPIGRMLIAVNGGDVTLFVVAKLHGTLAALAILSLIRRRKPDWAFPVAGPVTLFQLGLLLYLTTG